MAFNPSGSNLSNAGDVALSSPLNNQVLTYDSTISKWKNAVGAGGASIFFNVTSYGATGNGTSDDTLAIAAAITAANTAGGGVVYFPAGTYLTAQQLIYANITYAGDGPGASIVKLKNGANTDLFITSQFNTLTGTTANGPSKFAFTGLTLDANRTNQTATALCARIYGYSYTVNNVWFINGYKGGVYSEWSGPDNPMESSWNQFKIWNYGGAPGGTGLEWNGPHDSMFANGIIATLDSTIRATDVSYGSTPVNGNSVALPAAGTSFTFATIAAAPVASYPTSGGTFVVPIASGVFTWATINYTGASTSGSVTTFTGCTSPQGAINVTASGGIVLPTYGYRDRSPSEGTGHTGLGEMLNTVHVWGRNHFGIYTTATNYYSNCESEGAFIANVVLDCSANVWSGGTIYGSNGQTGQANETGLQIGQNNNAGRNMIFAFIYNVGSGSSGASIKMTRTTGNNILRVAGTTASSTYLSSPFYNSGGDWYEILCHNNQSLSVYHVPYQQRLPLGLWLGNGTALPVSGGHFYSGSGAPSVTGSVSGDYYFRTDTPTTASQQVYIATGANTWTAISSGSGGGGTSLTEGGNWTANTAYTQGQVVTNPTGDRVVALSSFTSGSTYDASRFVIVGPFQQVTEASIPNLVADLSYAKTRGQAVSTASYSGTLSGSAVYTSNPLNGLDTAVFGTNPASTWDYQVQATNSFTVILQASANGSSGWQTISTKSSSTLAGMQVVRDNGPVVSSSPYLQATITNGSTSQTVRFNLCVSGTTYSS